MPQALADLRCSIARRSLSAPADLGKLAQTLGTITEDARLKPIKAFLDRLDYTAAAALLDESAGSLSSGSTCSADNALEKIA